MAEPARELLERLALAAVGAVALTAERLDELAGELSERGGMGRDEARQLLEDSLTRWRGDATRLGERAGESLHDLFARLGLVTRDELDELELRVAQLEHRLRLVEGPRIAHPRPRQAQPVPQHAGFSIRPSGNTETAWACNMGAWRSLRSATSGASPRSPRSRSGTGSGTSSRPTS